MRHGCGISLTITQRYKQRDYQDSPLYDTHSPSLSRRYLSLAHHTPGGFERSRKLFLFIILQRTSGPWPARMPSAINQSAVCFWSASYEWRRRGHGVGYRKAHCTACHSITVSRLRLAWEKRKSRTRSSHQEAMGRRLNREADTRTNRADNVLLERNGIEWRSFRLFRLIIVRP